MTDDGFKVESGKTNFSLTVASVAGKQRIFKLTGLAHEITGVKVAQKKGSQTVSLKLAKKEKKTWHKLLDDASTKEAVADDTANSNTNITSCANQSTLSDFSKNLEEPSPTVNEGETDDQIRGMDSHEIQCEKEYWNDLPADTGTLFFPDKIVMEQHNLTHFPSQPWCKVQEAIKGLNDEHSKFEIEQVNVTDTRQCVISTIDHVEQVDHRKTGKGKSKHTGKGKGKHVDVVETEQPQPSETATTVLAIVEGDADESMDMVRPNGAEAWRLIHSRYAQNNLTADMISGSLFHDHADEHNQLPDEFVVSMESKEQKQTEDLAGMQVHHHELRILLPRSLDE